MTRTRTATTDLGTGLALPISKAIYHLLAVHTAITRDWPMTNEQAAAEMQEAERHLNSITATSIDALISIEMSSNIADWRVELATLTAARAALPADDNIANTPANVATMARAIQAAWRLLSALDTELTGLTGANADPGRLP